MPAHDERHLFEMLILEGSQAGLSWRTILNKRENYRRAFDNFDADKIARYGARKVAQLVADPRHRAQSAKDRRDHRQRTRDAGVSLAIKKPMDRSHGLVDTWVIWLSESMRYP